MSIFFPAKATVCPSEPAYVVIRAAASPVVHHSPASLDARHTRLAAEVCLRYIAADSAYFRSSLPISAADLCTLSHDPDTSGRRSSDHRYRRLAGRSEVCRRQYDNVGVINVNTSGDDVRHRNQERVRQRQWWLTVDQSVVL